MENNENITFWMIPIEGRFIPSLIKLKSDIHLPFNAVRIDKNEYFRLNRIIELIRFLCLAQIASDAAKGITYETNVPGYNNAIKRKYKNKTYYLLRAIQIIDNNKDIGVKYYPMWDELNRPMVYFILDEKYNSDGHPMMMSFHTDPLSKGNLLYDTFYKHGKYIGTEELRAFPPAMACTRKNCSILARKCRWTFVNPTPKKTD